MNRTLQAILLEGGLARPFAAADALGAAALVARTRGLAYAAPDGRYFDADRLAAEVARGEARAVVVVAPDGRIAALAALASRGPGALEVGARAVDVAGPAERAALARRLWSALVSEARAAGARALVLEEEPGEPLAPSDGPEAPSPAWIAYAGLGDARLVRVLPLVERPPARAPRPPADRARSEIEVDILPARRLGRIRVRATGHDGAAEVERIVEEMRRGKLLAVEARVPLDEEDGAALAALLEARGFARAGRDPGADGRDEAVLLRLTGGRLDPAGACGWRGSGRGFLSQDIGSHEADPVARALGVTLTRGLARGARTPEAAAGDTCDTCAEPIARITDDHDRDDTPPPPVLPPLEMIEFARLAGQKQLVAGISHEINNPLNIILGTTYVLKGRLREGRSDDAIARLASIEEEVGRVAKVLDGLRRFAHPEANGRARVEAGASLEDAASLVAGEAAAAGVDLVRDVPAALPPLRANRAEVAQVVFQLLKNALEASAAGGSITLEARASGDNVRVAVRDRGRGIGPEDLRRVFDPFFTTKSSGVGAGLGLSIARAIIEGHGGRLRLESRPGEGTAAVFELPVWRERGVSQGQGQQGQASEARSR